MASKYYNKHLTLSDRIKIEQYLNEGKNFTQIANDIFKDPSTISKEIKQHRLMINSSFNPYTKTHYNNCDKLSKPPYICNGCSNKKVCHKIKYYYRAKDSYIDYKNILSSSRQGINMSFEAFNDLNKIVCDGVNKGHSFSMILNNNKDTINVSKRTLYNYIELGYFDINNAQLPRKVRYKQRRKKKNITFVKDTKIRENRTYKDFINYIEKHPNLPIVEMDTVIGEIGGKALLTFLFRQSNFMIAFLLDNNDSDNVTKVFIKLKEKLGFELFYKTFPIILTDNGREFSNPLAIEDNGESPKTHVFYCDPRCSEQKGKLEKNHEYIRYILPKNSSFDNLTGRDTTKMINHINSVPRESLNNNTPWELASLLIDYAFFKALYLKPIKKTEVILKPYLLKK